MPAVGDFQVQYGIFKDAWKNGIIEPYANIIPLLRDMPLNSDAQVVGGVFHVPTRLTYEGGQTFAPGSTSATAVTPGVGTRAFVGPRAGAVPDANVVPMQVYGRSQTTYEALMRSMPSVNAGTSSDSLIKAAQAATKQQLKGLLEGTLKKIEALVLHGGEGIGQLDSAVNASNTVTTTYEGLGAPANAVAVDVALTADSWSEAMWHMFEGHTFDLFSTNASVSGLPGLPNAKLNTTPNTLLSGQNQTGLVLIAVNPATPLLNGPANTNPRRLRFWHAGAGNTAGVAGTGIIGGTTIPAAAAFHICFESAGPGSEFNGIGIMAQNQGSLFSIDAANYGMWRGNFRAAVGNLRLSTLVRALAPVVNAGAQGKKIRAVVPTEFFAQVANDESSLRVYSNSGPKALNGFSAIEFYLPGDSTLELLGHPLQKDGYVRAYCPDELIRVGPQDLQFVTRGSGGNDQLILESTTTPSSEIRIAGQFSPICQTPRHMLSLTGVTY